MSYNPYKLSIRLQSDGFSLSVHDEELSTLSTKNGKINFLILNEEELVQEFKTLFETDLNCENAELIIDDKFYTIVPDFFNDNETYTELMLFQHPGFDSKTTIIFNKIIDELNTNLIFSCQSKIINAINKTFKNVSISHTMVEFLEQIKYSSGIFLKQGKFAIDIAVKSENSLQLLNSYSYNCNEDILYHLLNIMYTLKLQADVRKVYIFANSDNAELQNLLTKHIPNTNFIQSKKINQ